MAGAGAAVLAPGEEAQHGSDHGPPTCGSGDRPRSPCRVVPGAQRCVGNVGGVQGGAEGHRPLRHACGLGRSRGVRVSRKRMSDKLYRMQYEEARTRGYGTRIFLGSTIGVVTASIAFPELDTQIMAGKTGLGPPAVAFVAGLSVKPVYAPSRH